MKMPLAKAFCTICLANSASCCGSAGETTGGRGYLKDAVALRKRAIDVVDLIGEQLGLIESRVGRCLHYTEDHALILGWRQLTLRKHVKGHNQKHHNRPQRENHRPV